MEIEEFNSPIWTGGMKAKVLNNIAFKGIYDVVSVDFEEKSVTIEREIGEYKINYRDIEIVK